MRLMNASFIILLLLSATGSMAQTNTIVRTANKTFTSADGTFKFDYPDSLILCKRESLQSESWEPFQFCTAYIPVCSNVYCSSEGTVACLAYPANEFREKTNLEAAAFSVTVLKQARNEDECFRVTEPPPLVRAYDDTINGVTFKVVETDGIGLGNAIDAYAYRSFHENECYELDIRIAFSSIGNYEPGTVKQFDRNKVHSALEQVLKSFEFLK